MSEGIDTGNGKTGIVGVSVMVGNFELASAKCDVMEKVRQRTETQIALRLASIVSDGRTYEVKRLGENEIQNIEHCQTRLSSAYLVTLRDPHQAQVGDFVSDDVIRWTGKPEVHLTGLSEDGERIVEALYRSEVWQFTPEVRGACWHRIA